MSAKIFEVTLKQNAPVVLVTPSFSQCNGAIRPATLRLMSGMNKVDIDADLLSVLVSCNVGVRLVESGVLVLPDGIEVIDVDGVRKFLKSKQQDGSLPRSNKGSVEYNELQLKVEELTLEVGELTLELEERTLEVDELIEELRVAKIPKKVAPVKAPQKPKAA